MKRILMVFMLGVLWLAACTGPLPQTGATQPPGAVTPGPVVTTPEPGPIPVDLPPGQVKAIEALATSLGVSTEEIQVASFEAVEWPDACLGVTKPGMMCAQVVTPGASLVLEANGVQYEYHTNQDGSVVVPATVALTWHQEGGLAGFCNDLTVILPDEAYASWCQPQGSQSEGSLNDLLSAEERAQLDRWLAEFGEVTVDMKDPATADAMTTTLVLHGNGTGQPSASEQQAMLDWAQALFRKLQQ